MKKSQIANVNRKEFALKDGADNFFFHKNTLKKANAIIDIEIQIAMATPL